MVYLCPFVALSKQLRNVDSLRCKLSGSLMGLNVCQLGVFFFCLFCACRWLVSQWHVPRVKKFSAIRPMRQFVFFLNKFLRLCKAESFLLFALSFFSFVPGRNASQRNPPHHRSGKSTLCGQPVSPRRPIFVCYFKHEIKKEAKHDPVAGMLRFRSAMSAMSWSKCTLVTSDSRRDRSLWNQHLD